MVEDVVDSREEETAVDRDVDLNTTDVGVGVVVCEWLVDCVL